MANTKITNLSAVTAPTGALEFAVNEAGTDKKLTLAQVNAFAEPICAANIADLTGFASDQMVTGLPLPTSRLKAGTFATFLFDVSKTTAGTAVATMNVRYGTAGSVADTSRVLFTFPSAQTAIGDSMEVLVTVNFRAVGASGSVMGVARLLRTNTTSGFLSTGAGQVTFIKLASGTFDTTPAGSILSLSMNGGASAAFTIKNAQAQLNNIT